MKLLFISLLNFLLNTISIIYKADAFSMKMFPIDSPNLNLLPQSLTIKDRYQFLIDTSLARANYANKNSAILRPNTIQSNLSSAPGWYQVTQVFIGSSDHMYDRYLILDTFADQTWFQCEGCNPCFGNPPVTVRPEDSPSFKKISLDDRRCNPEINYFGTCGFEASIGDSHTKGYLGTETFLFGDTMNVTEYIPNIVFGCGIENNNFNWDGDANATVMIAGVYGLAPGPKSFLNQLDLQIQGKFSYCIPLFQTGPDGEAVTTIAFGDDAQIGGDTGRTVETITMNPQARYHLYVAGISVGGNRLSIQPSVFELDSVNYTKGFFIDAASPITVLAPDAYNPIKDAVIAYFAQYKMEPKASGDRGFDLCFGTLPDATLGQAYPTVAFNFIKSLGDSGEVQLIFDDRNVFFELPSPETGFCLAMMPTQQPTGPSLFGAFQQANFKFLFDVTGSLLSFVPQKCKEMS